MIKRIFVFIFAIAFLFTAVSCDMLANPTEKYLLAIQNMMNAGSMESKSKFEMHLDLSKAKESVKEQLEKFKDITVNNDSAVDNKAGKQVSKFFANVGGVPLDLNAYAEGENIYFKSSLLGDKYYKPDLSAMKEKNEEKLPDIEAKSDEYKRLSDQVKQVWVDAVKNEIISSEGTSVENTPDGDIKVTDLSLESTDQKGKNILSKLADIVSKSSILLEQAKEGSEKYTPKDVNRNEVNEEIEKWFQNLPDNMKKLNGKYTLDDLKLTAKVDKDSNLINQVISGAITIKDESVGELKISVTYDETYWNINRKVTVDIPEIKETDIGDLNELSQEDSDMVKKFKESYNIK